MPVKPAHDVSYAKRLLFNLDFYMHPDVTKDIFAQWGECRTWQDRESWFWQQEAGLDYYQFGRVRSDEERWLSAG
jgi:hypothetical protein